MGLGASVLAALSAVNYIANAVEFDGTNDYLTRGADLTGNVNGKELTISFWMRQRSSGAGTWTIYRTQNSRVSLRIVTGSSIRLTCNNASGSQVFEFDPLAVSNDVWQHVLISFDLTSSSNRHVYFDGVAKSPIYTPYNDNNIDFTDTDHIIGASDSSGANKFDGDLADFWLDFNYIDLSVAANREKFIKNGKPVDLGIDGRKPTGTAPILFLSGEAENWHTNKGSGGGFTESGALTTASTSPSD
jgi:hypothetical protein